MKIAFGTVVYKESFSYLPEYAKSINSQDWIGFDLLLLNDNLDDGEIQHLYSYFDTNVHVRLWNGMAGSLPSSLRVELIQKAKKLGYDLLVLGDFDDTFSKDRISQIQSVYEGEVAFYYNELYYFDQKKSFFKTLPAQTNEIDSILECNYLGLSNTAINLNAISYELIEKLNVSNGPIFDWFLYSVLLMEGCRGVKVDQCKTYYRIHVNNIAGEISNNSDAIHKEIQIKLMHYKNLKNVYPEFDRLYELYEKLKERLNDSNSSMSPFVTELNDFWWGNLKLSQFGDETFEIK
ncbi:hypothetical protein [Paenibacillus cucumis (ex Kampfer et al. 2016)]|uniref:Glycosyltransferase n=1 Tax=Paenibacillus cucumis (ex Kampfer et al. 2016) TaxID=1776858 RepID=A0ABS7KPM5_9BACL|nr:hypothetical protein [Paenibacillus cucumis (ex Kampfer et al. 2016)]MBY0206039.1 hypothetical protein [Paenibacillus cucumis (ex Kampfer et al. 2016)]